MRKLTEYPFQPSLKDPTAGFHLVPAPVAAAHDERDALLDAVVAAAKSALEMVREATQSHDAGLISSITEYTTDPLRRLEEALAAIDKARGGE